jgi:hypothetical protein
MGKLMGLQQKMRSLYRGMQADLGFERLNGESVLYICDVPYKLESIIGNWIDALPDTRVHYDSTKTLFRKGPKKGITITEQGWEAFVTC